MCNENTIIDLDFSTVRDEGNWDHGSLNVLEMVDGRLVLDPDSMETTYVRHIGAPYPSNDRLRIRCNLEVKKGDVTGADRMEVCFQLWSGNEKRFVGHAVFGDMVDGVVYSYFLDRTYVIGPMEGDLTLKVSVPQGWQNKVRLKDLSVDSFDFCGDNVRTYFVVEGLLEDALAARSAAIQLETWEVDGDGTLPPAFFEENQVGGVGPRPQWKFARADLDGSGRVAEDIAPNTFNPFVDAFGLLFDNADGFYGGRALGTVSGSDYGQGILQLGFGRPIVLNGELEPKKGAFFIDMDCTRSLKVAFNVIVNMDSENVFANPTYFRKYHIEWDPATCEKGFYHVDQLDGTLVDQGVDGFLSGLTGIGETWEPGPPGPGTGPGTAVTAQAEQLADSGCASCWRVEVHIPKGTAHTVDIKGNFAPGGGYANGWCSADGLFEVTADVLRNIEGPVAYLIGIEGARTSSPEAMGTSNVTVTVREEGDIVATGTLEREHHNVNC